MSNCWLPVESSEVRELRNRVRELESQLEASRASRQEWPEPGLGDVMVVDWDDGEGSPVRNTSANIRRLGYEPEDFTSGGLKFIDIIHPDDARPVEEPPHWTPADTSGRWLSDRSVYRVFRPDGQERWVLDCSIAACDDRGYIRSARGYLVDITDDCNKDPSTNWHFSAAVQRCDTEAEDLLKESYDRFRGPTAAIEGHLGMLLSGTLDPQLQREHLQAIRLNCDYLRRIASRVGEFLAQAEREPESAESGRLTPQLRKSK